MLGQSELPLVGGRGWNEVKPRISATGASFQSSPGHPDFKLTRYWTFHDRSKKETVPENGFSMLANAVEVFAPLQVQRRAIAHRRGVEQFLLVVLPRGSDLIFDDVSADLMVGISRL